MRIGITVNKGIVKVETEDDGSLSPCNIAAQFPNVSGLKYLKLLTSSMAFVVLRICFFHLNTHDGEILIILKEKGQLDLQIAALFK